MPKDLTIYDNATMLDAVQMMVPVPSFLMDTFVRDEGTADQDEAIWDYMKGESPMAPFVHKLGATLVEREGYHTNKVEFPTLGIRKNLEAKDLTKRLFGEKVFGGKTPEERSTMQQMKDLLDLRRRLAARREWMAAKTLLEGKIEFVEFTDDGRTTLPTKEVDYGFTNSYVADNAWNGTDADIQADMDAIFALVEAGLGTSEIMVMAPDVRAAIMSNEKFLKKLDLLHVNNGSLTTQHRYPGVIYMGISPSGQEMYSYYGKVVNESKAQVQLIPNGKLICGSRGMLRMVHGPITKVDKTGPDGDFKTYLVKELPWRMADENANLISLTMMSRPLIIPFNVDAWVVADVL